MVIIDHAAVTLAKELIALPSITPDDQGCQKRIRAFLEPLGFQCETFTFDGVENLWARLGNKAPLLVFAGHTDVVPTGPAASWTTPPFEPSIRDGFLYGRGASDMKGALAAMLIATANFLSRSHLNQGSIAFLFTSDEEGEAINGTRRVIDVLQQRGEKIDYCIVGEPSSDQTTGDQVRVGRRGSLHGSLVVRGKQGHVAHPHLAMNPIHHAMMALHELSKIVWDEGNEFFPPTTFQITNIHGGTGASNVIPGHLEVLFNFRFSTASTPESLQRRTEELLKRYGLNYEIVWTIGAEPFLTKKGILIQSVQQAIREIAGLETQLSTGGGTSDGRFIAPTGAELVELGVPHTTAHHIDECVALSDLEKLTLIYQRLLEKIFNTV